LRLLHYAGLSSQGQVEFTFGTSKLQPNQSQQGLGDNTVRLLPALPEQCSAKIAYSLCRGSIRPLNNP
jgi:hypothetical protein